MQGHFSASMSACKGSLSRIYHERAGCRVLNARVMVRAVSGRLHLNHITIPNMLTIVLNIYQSLTNSCIHTVYLLYYTILRGAQGSYSSHCHCHVESRNPNLYFRASLNKEKQIFISGNLALSPPHHSPRIEVSSGDWILHNGGLDEDVADNFTRAQVYRTVYVNMVNFSVGRVIFSLLVLFFMMVKIKIFTMHRSPLKQLGMLQCDNRIHIQGWITTGVRQEEGIIVIKVEVAMILMWEASTPYALRDSPRKRFKLNTPQGKPQTREKRGGIIFVKNCSACVNRDMLPPQKILSPLSHIHIKLYQHSLLSAKTLSQIPLPPMCLILHCHPVTKNLIYYLAEASFTPLKNYYKVSCVDVLNKLNGETHHLVENLVVLSHKHYTPTTRRWIYCDEERVARNNLNLEYFIVEAEKYCKGQFIHIVLTGRCRCRNLICFYFSFAQDVFEERSSSTSNKKEVRLINLMRDRAPFQEVQKDLKSILQ
ncbi:hypothetical protein VP01_3977g2 [Puccinia sorghi]|uniref:Uncharacterized protein n=1 Tax=Puccinia sorghi TaxID=27349 RepID=A0A0L6US70_9BASI|nr:hypothetical protein VP01_3977g2 [Puccinia sorghi]